MPHTGTFFRRSPVRILFALLLLGSPVAAWSATAPEQAGTEAQMKQLQKEAKALRNKAELDFKQTEAECYRKFLVNRCIDQARQQRLQTILRARALEAEARQIDLAQRQRAAAEALAAQPATGAADTGAVTEALARPDREARVAEPSPATAAEAASTSPASTQDGERIRAARAREAAAAEAAQQTRRAQRDAERDAKRARSEAEAAQRASAAERDRARYEERLRRYEEEQAEKKK